MYAFDCRFGATADRTQLTKNGETTYYQYNTLNQLTLERSVAGALTYYQWQAGGALESKQDVRGTTIGLAGIPLGRRLPFVAKRVRREAVDTSTAASTQEGLRAAGPKRRRLARCLLVVALSLLGSCLLLLKTDAGLSAAWMLETKGCEGCALTLCRGIESTNLGMPLGFKAHRLEVAALRSLAAFDRRRAPEALEAVERYRANAEGADCPSEVLWAVYYRASLYAVEERWEDAASLLLSELQKHPEQPRTEAYLGKVIYWLSAAGDDEKALALFDGYAHGQNQSEQADCAVMAVWDAFRRSHREQEGRAYLLRLQAEQKGRPLDTAIAHVLAGAKAPLPPVSNLW